MNFGYSKSDYSALTLTDKSFILKAYEDKVVRDTTFLRNAVKNAVDNAFRKKGRHFIPLWKKNGSRKDREFEQDALNVIRKNQKLEGKSWISNIYRRRGGVRNS